LHRRKFNLLLFRHTQVSLYIRRLCNMLAIDSFLLDDYKALDKKPARFNPFFLWRCDPTRVMASSLLRFLDHKQRRTKSIGLLWTSDQLIAETSTLEYTKFTTEELSFARWNSYPRSQQASGRRPLALCKNCTHCLTFWHRSFTFKF
jgi:hypothetical protein